MSFRSLVVVRVVVVGLVAVVLGAPVASAQHGHGAESGRPPDGLLDRPALQSVVDAQVQRDGAALVNALDARDPDVRARAAFALASVQDTAAIPALVDRLRDGVPEVRIDAAFALGQMGEAVSSNALFDVLAFERDDAVQAALVGALGKTGDAASLRRLVTLGLPAARDADVALAVARYAARDVVDSVAVRWLTDRLDVRDPETREHVAYVFGRGHDGAVWDDVHPPVRRALDGYAPDDPAAMHLVAGLGRWGDDEDVERLLDWLVNAEDARTRVNAARGVAPHATRTDVRDGLFGRLDDPSRHVAIASARALAASGAAWTSNDVERVEAWIDAHAEAWRVVAPLLDGLARAGAGERVERIVRRWKAERPPVVYAAALAALAPVDTESAFRHLIEASAAETPHVAAPALRALADRWERVRDSTSRVDAYFDAFAAGVERGDVATVNAAAPVLTDPRFDGHATAPVLAKTLDRLAAPDDLEAMTALMQAMGEHRDTTTTAPALRAVLTNRHPALRRSAAQALTTLTGDSVVPSPTPPGPTPPIRWDSLRALGPHPRLVLDTEKGRVVVELDAEQAPQTVQTIAGFARDGRYDGVPFHRVVANFVVQGGDFAREDGWGGPGFFIRSEFTRISFARGVIGMASAGKDTEGSQFFLTHSMHPRLDGRYTAFGSVVEGMDVVDRLLETDAIVAASVEPSRHDAERE